jgi:predicted transcriptional regulator
MADEQVSITFRTASARRDVLDEIGRNLQRDRSFVLNEAVGQYLWRYEHEKRILAESHAAGERGELIDQEDIETELEQWIAGSLDRAS